MMTSKRVERIAEKSKAEKIKNKNKRGSNEEKRIEKIKMMTGNKKK